MKQVEVYWCEDVPTIEDIRLAFEKASSDIPVMIYWYVKYNGMHNRIITKDTISGMTPDGYFEKCIPHIYGV